jgi:DNA gyrase subunit A
MGRATQGVRLITLKNNDEIASVAKIEHDEDEEVKEGDENAEGSDTTAENTGGDDTAENGAEPSTDDTTE